MEGEEEGSIETILLTEEHTWEVEEEAKRMEKAVGRLAQLKE